jgi:hypothetical protein
MPVPPPRRPSGLRVERLEDRTVPSFSPFQNPGGLSIAIGDVFPEVTGAAANEVVVGSGPGQLPIVRVYDLNGTLEAEFLAYEPGFTGGVNVAVANVATDEGLVGGVDRVEIITGTGPGGGPLVKVFNPNSRTAVRQFLAYEATFRGGVNVAGGQVDETTSLEEVVTGAGFGGGPVVRVFRPNGTAFSSFFAYESSFRNGVNVAVGDAITIGTLGINSGDEIITGPGEGGAPLLKIFDETGGLRRSFFAFDFQLRTGLVVASGANTDGTSNLGEEIFAATQFTPLTAAPVVRAFNGNSAGQIESEFSPFPAGFTRYINIAAGEFGLDPTVPFPFNIALNSGEFLAVAGEGPTAQAPAVQFGGAGSAAGNNGP